MKRVTGRLVTVCINLVLILGSWTALAPAQALGATPPPSTTISIQETPPPSVAPDLIITSIVGSSLPQYIELYNQGDTPFNLHGWQITATVRGTNTANCDAVSMTIRLPDDWILSKKYLTLEQATTPMTNSLTVTFAVDPALLANCIAPRLISLALAHASDDPEQLLVIPADTVWPTTDLTVIQHKQRNNSPGSTRTITGTFLTDYKFVTGGGDVKLNSDPLYTPPADVAGLQVLEILPNARSCSPQETDPTCNDYVKLFNPTGQPINLALYRLRAGYKGIGESITNTFTWNRELDPANDELVLPPQTYFMLATRNDGQPLSITDTGNYIWLEDAYGTTYYGPIVQYPDASSTTNVGSAWAYDGTTWRWTTAPQPSTANYFPPEIITPVITPPSFTVNVESDLKPCADNQFRNPLTHRCNTIITASAVLAPCDEGEERNPATNRCRAIVTASSELTPCQPDWERNPETNRCRKSPEVAGASTTATAVKDVPATTTNNTGWFVAAIAIGLACSYGLYEWCQELRLLAIKGLNGAATIASKLFNRP